MSDSAQSSGATSNSDPGVSVYRVVDATELAYLRRVGDYGSNPSRSGKYFALTLLGARAFAGHPINQGSIVTEATLPQSVVSRGFSFVDPGPHGAGSSVFFDEMQLPIVYGVMTRPVVV